MNLVMFDMDGTLTDTTALDSNCYIDAIEQALGLVKIETDWESYPHASSSCCLEEIVRRAHGRDPTAAESRAVQDRMIELMEDLHRLHRRGTREIPGAADCVRALQASGHAVAIASGDWQATAHHKLSTAQIPFEALPAAFCEASHVRTEIMRTSLARAATHHGREDFNRIVYIGDGAWDVRACREIGWPLIGIGSGAHGRRLRALGTSHVLPDFSDHTAFLEALAEATVPTIVP